MEKFSNSNLEYFENIFPNSMKIREIILKASNGIKFKSKVINFKPSPGPAEYSVRQEPGTSGIPYYR